MSTAFMRPGVGAFVGVPAMPLSDLAADLSLDQRLRIVAKALLHYRSWHPDFEVLAM